MREFLGFIFIIFFANALYGEDLVEFDYELDAYYSNISAFIDLDTANELQDASNKSEMDIYTTLFMNTLKPNIFLVEAALYPMPLFGVYFRKNNPKLYENAYIQNLNIVKSVTAGFEEPYSLSLFLGRMMLFNNATMHIAPVYENSAYIGYLFSVGDFSIKDNIAYGNRWMNFEFKLKGTRKKQDKDLDWSFRLGYKVNENKNFTDSFYFGARRTSIDYKKSAYSFLENSAFSTLVEMSASSYKLANAEFMVEKIFPLSWSKKISFGLGLGYLYTSGEKYSALLRDEEINTHQLIFRPNLKF